MDKSAPKNAVREMVRGEAVYVVPLGREGLGALEKLGVERDAEITALFECQERGLRDCALVSVRITRSDNLRVAASAIAEGLK